MSWLINLSGLALMALIVWWFWLAGAGKARRATHGAVDIIVDDGVYEGNHHGNADAGTTGHLPFYLPDEYVPGQTDRSLTRG